MQSKDLTRRQADALSRSIHPKLGYLHRLRTRMEKTGFSIDDPLYQRVSKARDALHDLWVHVYYLACDARQEPGKRTGGL
jgi:hypothetical protein